MSASVGLSRAEANLSFGIPSPLPMVLQTEDAECGLACLAMIAGFYGRKTDLVSLRQQMSASAHGMSLRTLIDHASNIGLTGRALRLEVGEIAELQLPCILHWEMNHFVVLKKLTRKGLLIHDPAIGQRFVHLNELSRCFTGIALELTPNTEFEKGEHTKKLSISHFWTHIQGLKRSLLLVISLSVLLQVFAVISPYFIQIVVDDVVLRTDKHLLNILAMGFVLLLVIEILTQFLREHVILRLSSKLNVQMAANVFRHLIRLPLDFFSKRHVGDLVSRFGSLHAIRELLTTGVVAIVVDGMLAIITLLVMFWYNVKLTMIVLGIVLLYALLRYALFQPLRSLSEEHLVAAAKENSHFIESIRAIQSIKLFEKETDRQNQWQNCLTDSINKEIKISRWRIGFDTANRFLFGIENIAIIYFAANAVTQNLLTVGMLYAFISYKSRFIGAMDQLITKWIEFKMLGLHFERLAEIVYTQQDPLLSDLHCSSSLPIESTQGVEGNIQIENIAFTYPGENQPIFSTLSIRILAGESVAIIGPSGSGKSTLMKCIMGLFPTQRGTILIDGHPIVRMRHLRKQMGSVMQDDQLMSGSIADNIACFELTPDIASIIRCAQHACLHDEVMEMGMQYETLVGDMGTRLSGGQKQRILLARALYKKPRILFMDEATSHLDTNNERLINQHIQNLSITRVIIAHRPDTIALADRVLKLESGRLTEVTNEVKHALTHNHI